MDDEELNWPKKGDRLFRGDLPDWHYNAFLRPVFQFSDVDTWTRYVDGYKVAGNYVIRQTLEHDARGKLDLIVYPAVFLYRHHFELALKTIIILGCRLYDEEESGLHHHNLLSLWKRARTFLEKHWPTSDNEVLDVTDEVLKEIAAYDPGSVSFRYPESEEGDETRSKPTLINVRNLGEVANRAGEFLTSCIGGMLNDLDQRETFLSSMREMYGHEEW